MEYLDDAARMVEQPFAKAAPQVEQNVFTVTKEGVVLPKGAQIPEEFIENAHRSSSYGVMQICRRLPWAAQRYQRMR